MEIFSPGRRGMDVILLFSLVVRLRRQSKTMEQRLQRIEASLDKTVLKEARDVQAQLEDMSAGTALTHQQKIMAPILYRKQAVLAAASTIRSDMKQVAKILQLLLIEQDGSGVTERTVTDAPILAVKPSAETVDGSMLEGLQTRVDVASGKLDYMLDNYQRLVAAVSEKLVMLDEEIKLKEAAVKE